MGPQTVALRCNLFYYSGGEDLPKSGLTSPAEVVKDWQLSIIDSLGTDQCSHSCALLPLRQSGSIRELL